jgi:hypothetical protein
MPKSRKRKPTVYQRVQARKRRDALKKKTYDAVDAIYREAMPQKQEYPPLSHAARAAAPEYKTDQLSYKRLTSNIATFIPTGAVKPRQRVKTANGKTYEGQPDGSVRRVVEVRQERKAA